MTKKKFVVLKEVKESARQKLQEKYRFRNTMEMPDLVKIVVSRGVGEALTNSKAIDISANQLLAITGQNPSIRKSKKSISNFKLRQGQAIACMTTLRSKRMEEFFSKLVHLVLPKIRDFRGVPERGFDGRGNYTLGLREDIIFPEIIDPDKIRGFHITFVTSASTDEQAYDLLRYYGMPFRERPKV